MFIPQRNKLVKGLSNLRLSLCRTGGDYADMGISDKYCECKFGYGTDDEDVEISGCAEVRAAINLLETLSEEEYKLLCGRAGLTIVEESHGKKGNGDPAECQKKKK